MKLKKGIEVLHHETRTIETSETLDLICRVAMDRFRADAVMYRQLAQIPSAPDGYDGPVGETAARLAEGLEEKAQEAASFARLFASARSFTVEIPATSDPMN
jgi:hypothetical protein